MFLRVTSRVFSATRSSQTRCERFTQFAQFGGLAEHYIYMRQRFAFIDELLAPTREEYVHIGSIDGSIETLRADLHILGGGREHNDSAIAGIL